MNIWRKLTVGFSIGLWAAGCGTAPSTDYGKVELLSVSGTVTLDGQPLAGAVVTFEAADGQFAYGLTDSGGDYTLQFDSAKSGVTAGKKTVRISTTRKILGLNSDDEGGEEGEGGEGESAKQPPAVEKVPERYNKKSELVAEVSVDKTEFDFDLKSN